MESQCWKLFQSSKQKGFTTRAGDPATRNYVFVGEKLQSPFIRNLKQALPGPPASNAAATRSIKLSLYSLQKGV